MNFNKELNKHGRSILVMCLYFVMLKVFHLMYGYENMVMLAICWIVRNTDSYKLK